MAYPKLVTAPTTYPASLAETKAWLRATEFDDDDPIIEICRKTATDHAEKFTGRAFIDQTWDLYLEEFPDDDAGIEIPKPPLIEVIGVFYRDAAGVEQEFPAASYVVDLACEPARILPTLNGSWPAPTMMANAVRVRFRAGYVDNEASPVGDVPSNIVGAILMIAATLFANRETLVIGQSAVVMPWGAEQLLRDYNVNKAMA